MSIKRGEVGVYSGVEIFHDQTGVERLLGCMPSNRVLCAAVPTWTQAGGKLIPESAWSPFDDCPGGDVLPIKDQNGWNGCTHWALSRTGEAARWASGQDRVEFAPEYSYFKTTGGMNVGTSIMDALQFATDNGLAPRSLVPANTRSPSQLSRLGDADAKRFRFERGSQITTVAEFVSALLSREAVEYSVRVGNGFGNLDKEGCTPLGWGPTNHAVMGFARLGRAKDGRWKLPLDNSWTTQWGDKGTAWVYADDCLNAASFEAFHLVAVMDDPQGAKVLPPV